MTAVLLAAGRGRRMQASDPSALTPAQRHVAQGGLKVLMPLGRAGRPLLEFALARLAQTGVEDVVVVVPPDHRALRAAVDARPGDGLRIRLVVQPDPDGTAGAVRVATPFVEAATCLVVNGDNLYPLPAMRALAGLDSPAVAAFSGHGLERDSGFSRERLAAFARLEADADGWLCGLHEKPDALSLSRDSLVSMNLWRLDRVLLQACADVARSARGEYELPAAVLLGLTRGARVRVVPVDGPVLDVTSSADVATVSRAVDTPETGW